MVPSSEVTHSPAETWRVTQTWVSLSKILREMEADLVNVDTFNVQGLVEKGVLLPLDDFVGADETSLNQEFYPSTLEQFRIDETLYALPINARPLMMHYDASLFAGRGCAADG